MLYQNNIVITACRSRLVVSLGIMISYRLRFASQILLGKVDCTIPLKEKRPAKAPANQVTFISYYCGGNFKMQSKQGILKRRHCNTQFYCLFKIYQEKP